MYTVEVTVTVELRETAFETMDKKLKYFNKYNVVVIINGKTYDPIVKR